MLMHYGDGRVVQGILLSLKGGQMRVAVKDADDVVEIRLIDGVWISECCQVVTFEFPIAVFQVLGMVPEADNLNRQPDLSWHRNSATASPVDPLN
jgi:hypothetical protein